MGYFRNRGIASALRRFDKLSDRKLSDRRFGDTRLSDRKLGDRKLGDRKLGDRRICHTDRSLSLSK